MVEHLVKNKLEPKAHGALRRSRKNKMNSLDHPDYYRPFYELLMRDEYRKNPSFFLDFSFKEFPAKKYNLFPLKKEIYIEDFTLVKLDVLADAGKIKDYNFETELFELVFSGTNPGTNPIIAWKHVFKLNENYEKVTNFELSRVISCRKIVYTKYEVDNYEYSLTDSGKTDEIK